MKMNKSQNIRISRLAPAASVAVLVVSAILVANPKSNAPEIQAHHAKIASSLEDFPYAMGSWVGIDVDLPSAALEILRPNGFVSRRYSQMGESNDVTLGMVHCRTSATCTATIHPGAIPQLVGLRLVMNQ